MSDRNARLTIGVPVYNGEGSLGPTLDGILAQTYDDYVIVISDNASTDHTQAVAEAYAQRDDRIRYVRQPRNLGVIGNVNYLLETATSELFMWHAVDDLAHPTLVEACVDALDDRPAAVLAYSLAELVDEQGKRVESASGPVDLQSEDVGVRFAECLAPIGLTNNLIYGVMRRAVAMRTQRHAPFAGGDRAFVAELTLYAPFVRVDLELFQRRVETELRTPEDLEWYNSGTRASAPIRELRILRHNLRSICRAPLGLPDKLRLVRLQASHVLRFHRRYARELRMLLHSVLVRR